LRRGIVYAHVSGSSPAGLEVRMPQTVFITGADKGLGYCLAAKFAREGCRVFAGHLGDGARLCGLKDVIRVPQDVADTASIRRSVELVVARAGALDMLINNAGLCDLEEYRRHLIELDLSSGDFERNMAVNAFGPLRVTQALLPLLERGEGKRIVNISSEAGSIGECWRDFAYSYAMSKAALNMMAQTLQRELGPKGFKVLLLHPGWMRTDMGAPDAHLAPEESADLLYGLATKPWAQDDPMYMDYNGRIIAW
jgi:NAD(P)-dependent dehydrogenase (short-subunit alcohol dehydrogenase family)